MLPSDDTDTLELRDYLAVVRRRRGIVVIAVVAVVAAALVLSFVQTPVYRADVELLLQSRASEEIFAPEGERAVRAEPARVATEIGVMESRSVRDAVAEALGHEAEVTIQAQGQTDLVTISAEDTDPAAAATTANTYAEVYIATRRQQLVDDLQTAIDQVQAKITDIGNASQQASGRLAAIDAEIAEADSASERQALQAERADVEDQIEAQGANVAAQQAPYVAQLDRLQLATNLIQTGGAQIVSAAEEPEAPVRPVPARNGVIAAVVGLMLGVGLAFLREYLDDSIATKDDLQHATGGLPVLGLIPTVANWKDKETAKVVSLSEPNSAAAEAYRSLRTAVQFIGLDHPVQVIQVTSANASEGKTTTLANLAVALARAGQRVIVVSCDLRRPRVHEFLGLPDKVGFTSVLLGDVPLGKALQPVAAEGRLALLAAGPTPPNPSELLASKRAEELVTLLKGQCDILLLDCPPVLPVTDAIVLARFVDATVLVGTANRTTRKEIHRSVELLHQVGAPLIGTVLNGVEASSVYGYGSAYGSAYGYVAPPKGAGRKRAGKSDAGTNGTNGSHRTNGEREVDGERARTKRADQ